MDNLRVISTGFKVLFTETYNSITSDAEILATKIISNDLQETYPWVANIPEMEEWIGERNIKQFEGYSYTLKNKKFESTVKVDAKYIEYDKAAVFAPAIKMMAEKAKKFPSKLIINLLINGDVNLAYDNNPFFGNHTTGQVNYTNKINLPLNETNLNIAYDTMLKFPHDVRADLLVVGPALRSVAHRLLNTDQNGTNSTYKLVDLLVLPQITDERWYLFDTKKAIKPFILQVAQEAVFEENASAEQLFMTDYILYGTKSFMNAGYTLPFLALYSTGQ